MAENKRPKIGLALGSGGPRGLAHIGVIKVLEENNIPIDFIAGSSVGSLIGGLYALTKDIDAMAEIALRTNRRKLVSLLRPFSLSFSGLLKGLNLERFFDREFGPGKKFSDLKIPFVSVATDIKTGEEIRLNNGYLNRAIRASISLPLIFNPVKINGRFLVDGGLVNPVPDNVVREMGADIVIAVNLFPNDDNQRREAKEGARLRIFSIARDSLGILQSHLAQHFSEDADISITPQVYDISWVDLFEFIDGDKTIQKGREAAENVLSKIKNLIQLEH